MVNRQLGLFAFTLLLLLVEVSGKRCSRRKKPQNLGNCQPSCNGITGKWRPLSKQSCSSYSAAPVAPENDGCSSVTGRACIFPFTFKGNEYYSCTRAESVNNAAWCATQVNFSTGEVVNGAWEDCDPDLCWSANLPQDYY